MIRRKGNVYFLEAARLARVMRVQCMTEGQAQDFLAEQRDLAEAERIAWLQDQVDAHVVSNLHKLPIDPEVLLHFLTEGPVP